MGIKRLHMLRSRNTGFTIVELLIVIVVIAILAAISIVAYNGIQGRARASATSSALTQSKKKIALWQVDNGTNSPSCSQFYELITGTGTGASCSFDYKDINYQYSNTSGTAIYCITATSSTTSYKASDTTSPTQGGCNGHGQGGVGAVTNLATNPNVAGGGGFGNAGAAGSSAVTSGGGYSGSTFMRRTFSVAGSAGLYYGVTSSGNAVPAMPGQEYTASAWIRASRPVTIRAAIDWKDSSGAGLTTHYGSSATANSTDWTRITVTGTAPANAAYMVFTFYNTSSTWVAGDWEDVDAIMITTGSTVHAYADGESNNWVWNGTPNNSTSTGPPV